uniref:Uncharacterized protein LOC113796553 n=1 Tax=Dermatophagoides pteronyssinus TaxID=6956 RepID=A0A6P6YCK3_DERPT
NEFFECFKFYIIRLEYSLNDYENHRIPMNIHTYWRAIWITTICWINIIGIIRTVIYPNTIELNAINALETKFHLKRMNLILSHLIIAYLLLDYLWLILFRNIIGYRFDANKLFIKYIQYDDEQLERKYYNYLKKFISIGNLASKLLNL